MSDKYTMENGTSCFYIHKNGHHCLKTVGDDEQAQKNAIEAMNALNQHESLCQLATAAEGFFCAMLGSTPDRAMPARDGLRAALQNFAVQLNQTK